MVTHRRGFKCRKYNLSQKVQIRATFRGTLCTRDINWLTLLQTRQNMKLVCLCVVCSIYWTLTGLSAYRKGSDSITYRILRDENDQFIWL